MFHNKGLQDGIMLAMQESKDVLCFVHGHSQKSQEWEDVLTKDDAISSHLQRNAICLRMKTVSLETQQLSTFCPVKTTPAVILIHNGAVQLDVQSSIADTEGLRRQLKRALGLGETLASSGSTSTSPGPSVSLPQEGRFSPSVEVRPSFTPPVPPPSQLQRTTPDGFNNRQGQISEYVRLQKDRELKQRAERERIKQQIKADREERKRTEQIRRQPEAVAATSPQAGVIPEPAKPKEIRIQVRMFDGSTKRRAFSPSATLTDDVRPWIDSSSGESVPYNIKLILTPLPNRNIEAAEEEQSLTDLEIKGSATFVLVPVKGYVDSYAKSAPGAVGSAMSGGYGFLSSTVGAAFGGVRSMLGYGERSQPPTGSVTGSDPTTTTAAAPMRIRTLADQRAEEAKKDQQFYNGNQLNFEPRKDEDSHGT